MAWVAVMALETEDVPRLGQSESVAMETLSKFSIDIPFHSSLPS